MIEHAHHDLLAEQRAQRRDAEVDVGAVLGGRAQAAVLRQPLLRDVHAGHDLQAGDQPFVDPLRQVHHFLEQAVEAVADEDALLHRLDVDVARLALDRALHHQIDEVDDRRRFAAFLQAGDRLEDLVFEPPRQRGLAGGVVGAPAASRAARRRGHRQLAAGSRRRAHQRLVRVAGLNRVDDVAARRDDLLDAVAGLELEILDEAEQQRIGHRHRQQVLLETDGDAHALERDFLGNQDDGGRIGRVLGEVDVRESELERERLRDLLFGREVHAHEHDAHAFAGALVLRQRGRRSSSVMRPAWIRHSPIFLRNETASVGISDCVEPTSDCTERFELKQRQMTSLQLVYNHIMWFNLSHPIMDV